MAQQLFQRARRGKRDVRALQVSGFRSQRKGLEIVSSGRDGVIEQHEHVLAHRKCGHGAFGGEVQARFGVER